MTNKPKGFKPTVLEMTHVEGYVGDMLVKQAIPHAYVVTGLPMPGEKVMDNYGVLYEVAGMATTFVKMSNGDLVGPTSLTPYDPDEALREKVAELAQDAEWKTQTGDWTGVADSIIAAVRAHDAKHGGEG